MYKKNEKYRLQVAKNSLQSLAKAIEHMLCGGLSVGKKAMAVFERIDPSEDAAIFIRTNRQPYERIKQIVATHHGNESLNDVMQKYLASRGGSAAEALDTTDVIPLSSSDGMYVPIPISGAPPLPKKIPVLASTLVAEDDQAPLATGYVGGNTMSDAGVSVCTGEKRDEGFTEVQPLEVSDFQKRFKVMLDILLFVSGQRRRP